MEKGVTPEEILEFGKAYAAARVVTIAMLEQDTSKALAASKDILDRTQGRATEKKQIEHKFESLEEEQLDSIINTKLKKLNQSYQEEDSV